MSISSVGGAPAAVSPPAPTAAPTRPARGRDSDGDTDASTAARPPSLPAQKHTVDVKA